MPRSWLATGAIAGWGVLAGVVCVVVYRSERAEVESQLTGGSVFLVLAIAVIIGFMSVLRARRWIGSPLVVVTCTGILVLAAYWLNLWLAVRAQCYGVLLLAYVGACEDYLARATLSPRIPFLDAVAGPLVGALLGGFVARLRQSKNSAGSGNDRDMAVPRSDSVVPEAS